MNGDLRDGVLCDEQFVAMSQTQIAKANLSLVATPLTEFRSHSRNHASAPLLSNYENAQCDLLKGDLCEEVPLEIYDWLNLHRFRCVGRRTS
jgi:hypothetical protein